MPPRPHLQFSSRRCGRGLCGRLTSSLCRPAAAASHAHHPQSDHKALHKPDARKTPSLLQSLQDALGSPTPLSTDPETGSHNPFPDFAFTGAVRPCYPLSSTRKLPEHIPRPDYALKGIPRSEYAMGNSIRKIAILNENEIEAMRTVCRLSREVLDMGAAALRPGVTTDEIDEIVHKASIDRGVIEHIHIPPCSAIFPPASQIATERKTVCRATRRR